MDYTAIYNKIIDNASNRILEGYVEKHHVIPRCMGGSDDIDNIVELTAREHYVAHQLLVKMHPNNNKLAYAAMLMTTDQHGNRVNNAQYGWIKEKLSNAMSERMSGRKQSKEHIEKLASARRGQKRTVETCMNISEGQRGRISGFKGKTHSDEWKKESAERMSSLMKGRTPQNKGQKGKFGWFTDGSTERFLEINNAPADWVRGRSCTQLGKSQHQEKSIG